MGGLGSVREKRTATRLGLTEDELGILLHSLGIQRAGGKWSGGGWRNNFCAGPETDSHVHCKRLVRHGWMNILIVPKDISGDSTVFCVSGAAIAALRLTGWKIKADER